MDKIFDNKNTKKETMREMIDNQTSMIHSYTSKTGSNQNQTKGLGSHQS